MKKILLCTVMLWMWINLTLPLRISGEGIYKHGKDTEAIIDETIREVDKFISEISTEKPSQPKPGIVPKEEVFAKLKKKETPPIDLDIKQANLEDVIRIIANAQDINIVLDPALKGRKIDLHLKGVTVDEVLEALYRAYNLSSHLIGSILFISTDEKIKKGTTITKVIELKNISIKDATALISNLVTSINQSEETNTLVVIGTAEDIKVAEGILKSVDLPQPQVYLDTKIIEIGLDALKEVGIDWSNSTTVNFQETVRKTTLCDPTLSVESPLRIYKLARDALEFNAIINMLEEQNKAKVLSNPKISTINNKEAEIFIGDKIPYTVNTVVSGAVSTSVEFVEPGIRLKITPSIIEEDFVVIKVEPEVSYIYTFRGGASGSDYPWVKSRQATAYVRVKNGQSFVLGGLLSKEDKKNLHQVPFLKSIPILGNLFKYEKTTDYKTELIITITPTVFTGSQ